MVGFAPALRLCLLVLVSAVMVCIVRFTAQELGLRRGQEEEEEGEEEAERGRSEALLGRQGRTGDEAVVREEVGWPSPVPGQQSEFKES